MSRSTVLRAGSPLLVGGALTLITLNQRPSITAVGPVLDDIRRTLHLSATVGGLVTTAPVLCFGLAAPLAPRIARRVAPETALLVCMLALAAGLLLRVPLAVGALFAGTVVLGLAIAVANVLMPAVIKRDFERPGTMMGIYSMGLSGAGALGAGLAVPLERALGGSWRWALAFWAAPALLAAVAWLPTLRAARRRPVVELPPRISLWRERRAWMVSGLMGCQSLLFYSIAAWLPDILKAAGASKGHAGLLLSVAMIVGIVTSMAFPVLGDRLHDQRPLALGAVGLWVVGQVGLLVAPSSAMLFWVVMIGLGQGAGLGLGLSLFALRTPDGHRAAALSGMAQTVGYLVAAVGPLAVGAVHDATGSWDPPLILMLGVLGLMLAFGLAASRPGLIEGRPVAKAPPTADVPAVAAP